MVRSKGKKLIGAQASPELWAGVDRWLANNPGRGVSAFLLEACLEKLDRDGILLDRALVLRDGRVRVPSIPAGSGYRDDDGVFSASNRGR